MTTFKIDYPAGATPLDPNEMDGLIPDYITTQGELNELERANILEATAWAHGRKHSDYLNATFAMDLHKRMFGQVWRWAGTPRKTNKTIGVFKERIGEELAQLFGDAKYWIENQTFEWAELGARVHHRLVWIHVFANGNGRHARLFTEILLQSNAQEPFSWGMRSTSGVFEAEGALRETYVSALKKADAGDFSDLCKFVRT